MYFYSIKINLYSIKYIYMILKKYFYSTRTNLYLEKKNYYITFFHPIKTFF